MAECESDFRGELAATMAGKKSCDKQGRSTREKNCQMALLAILASRTSLLDQLEGGHFLDQTMSDVVLGMKAYRADNSKTAAIEALDKWLAANMGVTRRASEKVEDAILRTVKANSRRVAMLKELDSAQLALHAQGADDEETLETVKQRIAGI